MYIGGKATDRARGFQRLPTPDELWMPIDSNSSEGQGAKVMVREGNNPDQQLRSLSHH